MSSKKPKEKDKEIANYLYANPSASRMDAVKIFSEKFNQSERSVYRQVVRAEELVKNLKKQKNAALSAVEEQFTGSTIAFVPDIQIITRQQALMILSEIAMSGTNKEKITAISEIATFESWYAIERKEIAINQMSRDDFIQRLEDFKMIENE